MSDTGRSFRIAKAPSCQNLFLDSNMLRDTYSYLSPVVLIVHFFDFKTSSKDCTGAQGVGFGNGAED